MKKKSIFNNRINIICIMRSNFRKRPSSFRDLKHEHNSSVMKKRNRVVIMKISEKSRTA